jgi:hypothetical protein
MQAMKSVAGIFPGWDYDDIMGYTDLDVDHIFSIRNHDHASAYAVWFTEWHGPESYFFAYKEFTREWERLPVYLANGCEYCYKVRSGLSERRLAYITGF